MKYFKFCSDFSKTGLKCIIFFNIRKGQRMAKWPNNSISGKHLKKGQMATLNRPSNLINVCVCESRWGVMEGRIETNLPLALSLGN